MVFQLCLRVDEPLGFVLQFDIGAQRVDTGAHAGLLQVSGLVKERLREINTRLCRFHIRGSAQAAEILRDHQRGDLFANCLLLGPGGRYARLRSLPAPPQRQIENRHRETGARLKHFVGAQVLWKGRECNADLRLNIDVPHLFICPERRLRQQT